MINDHIVVLQATVSAAAISGSSSTSSTRNKPTSTYPGATLLLEHCGKVAGRSLVGTKFAARRELNASLTEIASKYSTLCVF
jgi:hypothetical protein